MRGLAVACAALALALAGAARAAEPHPQAGAPPSYAVFAPLNATLLRADGSHGVLSVQGGLAAGDPGLRARAAAAMPRLRDAWNRVLAVYALALRPGARPDAGQIADRLQRATDAILQRTGARVRIGAVMVY